MRNRSVVVAIVAFVALIPVAPAQAADNVLVPPAPSFIPDLGGASSGAPCGGTVRCVGPSGTFATIGAAVAAAASGDTIQVQAGTYPERVTVSGNQLTLLGGFAAGFATRNPASTPSVIDGQGGGTTLALNDAGNATVDGFTITGGRAPVDGFGGGGGSGINVTDSGAVTIRNNLITGNDDGRNFNTCNCGTFGGGLNISTSVPGSSATVSGNIIRGNRALKGAGASIFVNALIEGNLVEDNHAGSDHGGGLYLSARNMTVRQNLIRGNSIGDQAGYGWGGGAIFDGAGENPTFHASFEANRWVGNLAPGIGSGLFVDEDGAADLTGDLFHDNVCAAGGAALYVDGTGVPPTGSTVNLENVTMADNVCPAGQRGSAIFTEGGSSISVTNSIIAGNGGSSQIFICTNCADIPPPPGSTIVFSLLGGRAVNVTRGACVLSGDPGFLDPAADDFHLAPDSLAIDLADPASSVGSEPEPNGGRRNAGAYGGSAEATTGTGGCIGSANFIRVLTIRYLSKADEFRGKLKAGDPACVTGRVKVLEQVPGKDKRVGSDKVAGNGRWAVDERNADGRYYATVAASGACPAAKSPVKRVG